MKFSFRKIASVLLSAVTLGSTVAMAANYPAPFVQNGQADVAIVYGAGAAASDFTAATKISSDLASGVKVTGVTISGTGDKYNIGKNKDFYLGTEIDDLKSNLDEDELPVLLEEGTYTNEKNDDFDYEQKITIAGGLALTHFQDDDYGEEPALGFVIADETPILNYTLDFTTDAESTVDGGDLVDIESTTLTLLGKNYFVLDADNSTLQLTLLDSANEITVAEGTPTTTTIGAKSYAVEAKIYSSSQAKLVINGETTKSLKEGDTYKLSDGSYVGVKEILYNSKETGISSVDISIGTGKLVLKNGNEIELNNEKVENVYSYITRGTASGGKEKIDKITIEWKQEDDAWLTEKNSLMMPGLEAVQLIFGGMNFPKEEKTEVRNDGKDRIVLKTEVEDGKITLNLLASSGSNDFDHIGKSNSEKLKTSDTRELILNTTAGDKWFVASYGSGTTSESFLLEVKSIENEDGKNKTTIESVGSKKKVFDGKVEGTTETLGDKIRLTINDAVEYGSKKGLLNISINSGGSFNKLYTKEGLTFYLPVDNSTTGYSGLGCINLTKNPSTWTLYAREEDEDGNIESGEYVNITLGFNSDNKVQVSDVTSLWAGGQKFETSESSDVYRGYVKSALATLVEHDTGSGDQDTLKIVYHGDESYADVFVAAPSVTTGTEAAIPVVKDSEVNSVSSKNLVVVGGSCVNSVAAQVLGVASGTCGEAFTAATGVGANQALVKVATSPLASSKIAMLVAGYEAADTEKAATYVTTSKPSTEAGTIKLDTVSVATPTA